MIRLALVVSLVAACGVAEPEPETSETSQAGTFPQGTFPQGTFPQGTSADGAQEEWTSLSGTMGGLAVSDVSVVGTALRAWRTRSDGARVQYLPDRLCVWPKPVWPYGFGLPSCSDYNLATQASPLAGSRWPITFRKVTTDGQIQHVHLTAQIGVSGQVGAVTNDTTTAMFNLNGSTATSGTVVCDDPGRCRRNTDLYLYDVKVIASDGSLASLCPAGERAFALAGTWDSTATFHSSTTQFTFACTNGTIAKCVRLGYRPWTGAISDYDGSGASPTPLAPYHQVCVHAAMADYCGINHSFTKTGTLIDISDGAFVKSTRHQLLPAGAHYTATVHESNWDQKGAFTLSETRYQELDNPDYPDYDVSQWCTYSDGEGQGSDDHNTGFPDRWFRATDGQPWLDVESAPSCAHTEYEIGKWLHWQCSDCTGNPGIPRYCTEPADPHGWDSECVAAATRVCTNTGTRMSPTHGECTTGVGLDKYDSGCTLGLSLRGYASCFMTWSSSAWSSTCVAAANQYCTGGREHRALFANYGFCNQPIPLSTTNSL